MVGILVSSWEGLFSGVMLVLGRVIPTMELTEFFFSLSAVDKCGCHVRICLAGLPGRCVQRDHPPLLKGPKALLRFESWPRDF